MAAAAAAPLSALSPLPAALALHIFSLLPADARARAACVCRGWCHVLLERSLWTRLDLSPSSGVAVRVTDAVLAGAVSKARGQLAALDVSGCVYVSFDALLAVVHANSGALRELCVGSCELDSPQTLTADRVERLLQAAPQLVACRADVFGSVFVADARRLLCNAPPFQTLRLRALCVDFPVNDADEASVLELVADMAAHATLTRVELWNAPLHTPAALDVVVDAALAGQFVSLHFVYCRLSPASGPALVRLLGSGTLTELLICEAMEQLLDGPSAAPLCAALRANSTLTALYLHNVDVWRDADVAVALLGALTGHSSLHALGLVNCHVGAAHNPGAGAALGALVAANAPALTELDVEDSLLGDAGLRRLFEALPRNTHLRTLNVSHTATSAAFAADVLLPAVRANTSLTTLHAESAAEHPGAAEATALVAARGGGGGGGGPV
jgi:hypothetical protein